MAAASSSHETSPSALRLLAQSGERACLHVSLPRALIEQLVREAAARPGGSIDDLITEILTEHVTRQADEHPTARMARAFAQLRQDLFGNRRIPGDSTEDIAQMRDELTRPE